MSEQLTYDSKDLCDSVLQKIDDSLRAFSSELRVIENQMMNTDKTIDKRHYKNMANNLNILIKTLKERREDIISYRRTFDPSFTQQKDRHLAYKDTEAEDIKRTEEYLESKFFTRFR